MRKSVVPDKRQKQHDLFSHSRSIRNGKSKIMIELILKDYNIRHMCLGDSNVAGANQEWEIRAAELSMRL